MKKLTCFVGAIVLWSGVAFGQGFADAYQLNSSGVRIDPVVSGSTQSVTVAAEPTIAQVPFLTAAAFGDVSGYKVVNKFGHNATAGAGDDVWGGDGIYAFYPTTAQTVYAVSDSAADDTSSTGAHTVVFYGLDSNWLEANETVTMDGVTPVALTNTYRRMFRGIVSTIGTAESNVGNLTVTNAEGTVAIYINANEGQTQHTIYTVPSGKSALFMKGYVAMGNDDKNGVDCTMQWQARSNNGTTGAWATKGQISLVNIGSSHWQYEYGAPAGMILAKTDLRIRVSAVNGDTTVEAVGGYDLLLKDE